MAVVLNFTQQLMIPFQMVRSMFGMENIYKKTQEKPGKEEFSSKYKINFLVNMPKGCENSLSFK